MIFVYRVRTSFIRNVPCISFVLRAFLSPRRWIEYSVLLLPPWSSGLLFLQFVAVLLCIPVLLLFYSGISQSLSLSLSFSFRSASFAGFDSIYNVRENTPTIHQPSAIIKSNDKVLVKRVA